MKLGRSNLIVNRTREALKSKAKRKGTYEAMRLLGDNSISGLYPSTSRIFGTMRLKMHVDKDYDSRPKTTTLNAGHTALVGFKFPYDDYSRFHINVWRECSDTYERSNMVITQSTAKDLASDFEKEVMFLFSSQKDVDEATAWWDNYRARFHDMSKTYLPKFANGQALKGCAYAIEKFESEDSYSDSKSGETDYFSEWVWMVQNTSDKIYWSQHFWFFENDGEMVQYKLTGEVPQLTRQMF